MHDISSVMIIQSRGDGLDSNVGMDTTCQHKIRDSFRANEQRARWFRISSTLHNNGDVDDSSTSSSYGEDSSNESSMFKEVSPIYPPHLVEVIARRKKSSHSHYFIEQSSPKKSVRFACDERGHIICQVNTFVKVSKRNRSKVWWTDEQLTTKLELPRKRKLWPSWFPAIHPLQQVEGLVARKTRSQSQEFRETTVEQPFHTKRVRFACDEKGNVLCQWIRYKKISRRNRSKVWWTNEELSSTLEQPPKRKVWRSWFPASQPAPQVVEGAPLKTMGPSHNLIETVDPSSLKKSVRFACDEHGHILCHAVTFEKVSKRNRSKVWWTDEELNSKIDQPQRRETKRSWLPVVQTPLQQGHETSPRRSRTVPFEYPSETVEQSSSHQKHVRFACDEHGNILCHEMKFIKVSKRNRCKIWWTKEELKNVMKDVVVLPQKGKVWRSF